MHRKRLMRQFIEWTNRLNEVERVVYALILMYAAIVAGFILARLLLWIELWPEK